LASQAVDPVRAVTGLIAAYEPADTVVVDRPAWIRSNVNGFATVAGPSLERLREGPDAVLAVGSRATAVQMGALLAWLSGKVLGQFEVFVAPGQRQRLLLVAPSIVSAERALGVNSHDFRLWVCMHEETHRVQFSAVPWLTGYLVEQVRDFISLEEDDPGLLSRVMAASRAVLSGTSRKGLIELLQTDAQRAILDRATALMSLLEGHADVVMDEVGPSVIPSVAVIRSRFDDRRHNPGQLDGLLRRFLGLDAKLRQYTDGARFVRGVVDRVGMSGFNQVWESADNLPTLVEIADPASWTKRVCT
jgi:coenzyme F420 biosynthesis associated uncharacterized protein